ncbi:hypothetical protein DID88_007482 [Monilinia fructigena]|uniref:Uncharacterized protein n=1 Tax=Monilinia fructigena TaxID=38457 RepID=A0A395IHZ0_9HELO|nr:hypothetical protein DID88_000430 [Monilinia fructigena]RAL66700.1 hypothetical protein DID88_007484 [Monilinia fructigena]RAL68791.1 hypothetical protein DID88_007482 [Monilinia fructigena]
MHELCLAPAKCNGCHGPFPAGHKGCPLAPRSTTGGKPQCNLTKAQVEAIRRNNRAVQKACAPGTATNTVPAVRTFHAGAQSNQSSQSSQDAQSTQSSANSTAPPSTARTFEIQVPATPREGGESAKRATDSPASQTRASKRAKAAPGQMNLKLLSRNSVRKARVEDAMDTDDDDIAASTQLTEDTNPFSNE